MITYLFILVGELIDLALEKLFGKTIADFLAYRMVWKPRLYWLELDLKHETLKFIGESPFKAHQVKEDIGNDVFYVVDEQGNHQYYTEDTVCYRMVTTPTLVDYEVIAVAFMQKPRTWFVEEHIQVGMYTFMSKHLKNYTDLVNAEHQDHLNHELLHQRLAMVNNALFEMQQLIDDYEPISD